MVSKDQALYKIQIEPPILIDFQFLFVHFSIQTTKRPLTAGTLFKNSMIALVKTLSSKVPYYVRCIKPNEEKSPASLDEERVSHQIRYLGLLENVRVRRAGFAHRQTYERFLKR